MHLDNKIAKSLMEYCNKYDVPIEHITSIISDLKVIPMIRGKAFEFTVSDVLRQALSKNEWDVTNPEINAQTEVHDIDVNVIRKSDNKGIKIECKLAGKKSFKNEGSKIFFKVKCMRSRTISDNEMATRMAKKYGVKRDVILAHADNYRSVDFDFVITTLGNALWTTVNGRYVFSGTKNDYKLLANLFPNDFKDFNNFQKEAFRLLLFAESKDIMVSRNNNVICSRRKCINKKMHKKCGFIPNYPIVNLYDVSQGKSVWKHISKISEEFHRFLDKTL